MKADKVRNGAVIGFFCFFIKKAGRNLVLDQVKLNALAADSFA
jgi:hypothetical protein